LKTPSIDEYSLKARAFPAFLAILPLVAILFPYLSLRSFFLGIAAPLGGTAIAAFLLAQLGRDAGKLKEPKLFESWGGPPTTAALRHRNSGENRLIRERRHRLLERMSKDILLPSLEAEASDPSAADEVYEAVTKILIQRTRDKKKYSLLFAELINYGFRRNLLGLKPRGISLLVAALAFQLARVLVLRSYTTSDLVLFVLELFSTVVWCFVVTPNWVRLAAEAYSSRLFDTLDQVEDPKPSRASKASK